MFFASSLIALATVTVYVSAANFKRVACPDGVNTATNAACCGFFSLRDDLLKNLFGGVCGEEVHETLRLSFHDAIAFSPALFRQGKFGGGGADGSMITFPDVEPNFPPNLGINDSVSFLTPFMASHNVTAGDLIQFANAVGLTLCPGAPRIKFLAGRPKAVAPAPQGLIPEPTDSLTTIFARMADAGFTEEDLVSLLASHSIGRSDHVDPGLSAVPFDTTPFTFDTQFFLEVQLKGVAFPGPGNTTAGEALSPLPHGSGENVGELRLQSDMLLARDPRTACFWQSFVNNQAKMTSFFAAAMEKLAVTGQTVSKLVDCSEVIPAALPAIKKPATFPAGVSRADLQPACAATPFPTLATDAGKATLISHCPPQQGGVTGSCDNDEGSL